MEKIENLSVISEQTIYSPTNFFEEHKNLNDQELLEEFSNGMNSGKYMISGTRGVNFWPNFLDKLRNREITNDFGNHEIEVPFLSFHIPPNGNGNLSLKSLDQAEAGFNLSLLGFGFGTGKKITFTINTDFGTRKKCFTLTNKVLVNIKEVKTIRGRIKTTFCTDILKVLDFTLVAHDRCPLCDPVISGRDSTFDAAFPSINLKNDPIGISQSKTINISESKEYEFGFDIQALGIKLSPSISINRNIETECTIKYDFPGGYSYHAYYSIYPFKDLPFWRRD